MSQTLTLPEARKQATDQILAEWFNSAEESQLSVNEWKLLQTLVLAELVESGRESL